MKPEMNGNPAPHHSWCHGAGRSDHQTGSGRQVHPRFKALPAALRSLSTTFQGDRGQGGNLRTLHPQGEACYRREETHPRNLRHGDARTLAQDIGIHRFGDQAYDTHIERMRGDQPLAGIPRLRSAGGAHRPPGGGRSRRSASIRRDLGGTPFQGGPRQEAVEVHGGGGPWIRRRRCWSPAAARRR